MLDIKRRIDIDPSIQQFPYVHVSLVMSRTGSVRVGKLIDKYELGMIFQNRIDVHFVDLDPPIMQDLMRDGLQTLE